MGVPRALHRMSGGTILMVEPNPGILIVARNVLTRAGYTVLAVAKAEEGIQLAKNHRIDVVLMDARQSDPRVMATIHAKHRVPIVITFQRGKPFAGRTDLDATQRGAATADFLEKPFAPERLLQTVERIIHGWIDRTPPLARHDTLVSARMADDDFGDNEQTDIFPFAHLLEYRKTTPSHQVRGAARDVRAGMLSERLRTFLEVEGIVPRPDILSACLRACDAVLESATDLYDAAPHGDARPAIEGVIPQLSIDQVLQLAMAVGQPARCRVAQDSAAIDVFYDQGDIAFARHAGLPDGFLLGRLLVATGQVSESAVMDALNMPRDGARVGQRLVKRGLLTETELTAALRLQTEELVYELVRWSTGTFSIYADVQLPSEARQAKLTLAVPHLLLEGMRRLDEWRRMQPAIGDLEAVIDRRETSSSALSGLTSEDREVLQHVDGRRTVAELIRRVSRPTFHVYRSLHSLAGQRLVTFSQP